jgi:hypothetical protein
MSERVYSLCEGHGEARRVLRWGVSRLGAGHDAEMSAAVGAGQVLGTQSSYVEWTPDAPRQKSAEAMQAHRIRNMRRRVQAKFPLFAEEFERDALKANKFSLAACQADRDASAAIDADWRKRWWKEHPESLRVYLPNVPAEARCKASPPAGCSTGGQHGND